uniref:Uncharacterized protein n=1 Tax=Zea mays TaxID=4577 RepID=B6TT47_MAIZE|nr:hypothetical protein [Zea mays]
MMRSGLLSLCFHLALAITLAASVPGLARSRVIDIEPQLKPTLQLEPKHGVSQPDRNQEPNPP